jgi:NADPH2:quinone reductase
MKAILVEAFDGPETLKLRGDVPEPMLGPGQIRIRVQAAAVSFVDTLIATGQYQIKPALPFSPGSEFAGTVVETGPDVASVSPGTQVMVSHFTGGWAEYAVVPAASAIPVPAGIDLEVAAGFYVNYMTVLFAFRQRGALAAGETLLVLGAAGGVGTAAIELGKLMGATVIATASSAEKRAYALARGAAIALDPNASDFREKLKEHTDGRGVDVIVDPVGGDLSERAFRSIAPGGRHLVIGFASGIIPKLPLNLTLLKGADVRGVDLAKLSRLDRPAYTANLNQLFNWLRAGELTPEAGLVFPFEQASEAIQTVIERRAVGKVLLRIGADKC